MKTKKQYYINRRAALDWTIGDRLEAGIALEQGDYPLIHKGAFDATKSFVWFYGKTNREMYWTNLVINGIVSRRKLLCHRREIDHWYKTTQQKKTTMIVLQLYKKNQKLKLEIAQAKKKNKWNKKETLKEKTIRDQIAKERKQF